MALATMVARHRSIAYVKSPQSALPPAASRHVTCHAQVRHHLQAHRILSPQWAAQHALIALQTTHIHHMYPPVSCCG